MFYILVNQTERKEMSGKLSKIMPKRCLFIFHKTEGVFLSEIPLDTSDVACYHEVIKGENRKLCMKIINQDNRHSSAIVPRALSLL